MATLQLALLGTPEVRHAGQPLTFPTRKALAVLVYLAVEGGFQARESLAALFWPESDTDRSRSALRNSAHDDEAACLVAEQNKISLQTPLELDLHILDDAWKLARGSSSLANEAPGDNRPSACAVGAGHSPLSR